MERTPELRYFEIWEIILTALRDRIREANASYGIKLELIEQPQRTAVIRDNRSGSSVVQASISLQGDSIEIRRVDTIAGGTLGDDAPEVIEITVKNGVIAYIHDDLDRTTDPRQVAEFILVPILYPAGGKAAGRETSATETGKRKSR